MVQRGTVFWLSLGDFTVLEQGRAVGLRVGKGFHRYPESVTQEGGAGGSTEEHYRVA